jgi:hypothetical protein
MPADQLATAQLRVSNRLQQPEPNDLVGGGHRYELSEIRILGLADELFEHPIHALRRAHQQPVHSSAAGPPRARIPSSSSYTNRMLGRPSGGRSRASRAGPIPSP